MGTDHDQDWFRRKSEGANLPSRFHAVHHGHAPVKINHPKRFSAGLRRANRRDGVHARGNIGNVECHAFEHLANHDAGVVVVVHHQRMAAAQIGLGQQAALGPLTDTQPHREPEVTARIRDAADTDLTAHQASQVFGDRQTEPGAAKLACGRTVSLRKALKQPCNLLLGQSNTGVAH